NRFVLQLQLERGEIDSLAIEAHNRRRFGLAWTFGSRGVAQAASPLPASHESAQARHQNGQLKRLGEVIVNPSFKTAKNIFRTPARSQHEDRNVLLCVAKLCDYLEPVYARQHYI